MRKRFKGSPDNYVQGKLLANDYICILCPTHCWPKACEYYEDWFAIFVNTKPSSLGKSRSWSQTGSIYNLWGGWGGRLPCSLARYKHHLHLLHEVKANPFNIILLSKIIQYFYYWNPLWKGKTTTTTAKRTAKKQTKKQHTTINKKKNTPGPQFWAAYMFFISRFALFLCLELRRNPDSDSSGYLRLSCWLQGAFLVNVEKQAHRETGTYDSF